MEKLFYEKKRVRSVFGMKKREGGCQDSILLCYRITIPITNTENRWIRNTPWNNSAPIMWGEYGKTGKIEQYTYVHLCLFVSSAHTNTTPHQFGMCVHREKKREICFNNNVWWQQHYNNSSSFVDTYLQCTMFSVPVYSGAASTVSFVTLNRNHTFSHIISFATSTCMNTSYIMHNVVYP